MSYILTIFLLTSLTVFSQGWVQTAEIDSVRYTEILNYGKSTYLFTNNYDKIYDVGIQRSTDDGVTWDTLINSNPEGFDKEFPSAYELIDENIALVSFGRNGDIFKYNFAENSIEYIKLDATRNINSIKMIDENNGICGNDVELFITEDGWDTSKKIKVNMLVDVFGNIENGQVVYYYLTSDEFIEVKPKFYRSTDNGENWSATELGDYDAVDMVVKNDGTILIVANGIDKSESPWLYSNLIYKSTDSGKTWVEKLNFKANTRLYLGDINFYNNDIGIANGNSITTYLTYDGGETWTKQNVGDIESLEGRTTYSGFTQTKFVLGVWNNGLYQKSITTSSVNSEELRNNYQYTIVDNILNFQNHQSINYKVYNMAGQKYGQGNTYDNIDLTQLEKGVYLINLNNEFTVKFIK